MNLDWDHMPYISNIGAPCYVSSVLWEKPKRALYFGSVCESVVLGLETLYYFVRFPDEDKVYSLNSNYYSVIFGLEDQEIGNVLTQKGLEV